MSTSLLTYKVALYRSGSVHKVDFNQPIEDNFRWQLTRWLRRKDAWITIRNASVRDSQKSRAQVGNIWFRNLETQFDPELTPKPIRETWFNMVMHSMKDLVNAYETNKFSSDFVVNNQLSHPAVPCQFEVSNWIFQFGYDDLNWTQKDRGFKLRQLQHTSPNDFAFTATFGK